jgi:hypothetical protein
MPWSDSRPRYCEEWVVNEIIFAISWAPSPEGLEKLIDALWGR